MHHPQLFAVLTAALASMPATQAGMYTKSSPVLQVDARNFDSLIDKSNHTSIVEFYAPWCGHCQNLKPAYEKAARNLEGLAKVAAIDCDGDANKPLCGAHGVQGFPTLKTFRPGKKPGKPVVEDYQGPRTASKITESVVDRINNHVSRISDKEVDGFLSGEGPKALLFTEKGSTSALLRSIAIDFLDVIKVGQVRNKEKRIVEKFGIEKFPTLVLIPEDDDSSPIVYEGDLNKNAMVEFLRQAGEPNPDPAPSKGKSDKNKEKKESKTSKTKESKAAEPESETTHSSTTGEHVTPISSIASNEMLQKSCLQPKSHTCVLALVPSQESSTGDQAVGSLSKLNAKYVSGNRHLFPSYALPASVELQSSLRAALELNGEVEVVAINAKRGWWRHYDGDFSLTSVEKWIDAIRMDESEKKTLPKDLLEEAPTRQSASEAAQATESQTGAETEAQKDDDEEIVHGEL